MEGKQPPGDSSGARGGTSPSQEASLMDGAMAGQRRGGRKGVCWLSQLSLPLWSGLRGSLWLSHMAAEYLSLTGGLRWPRPSPASEYLEEDRQRLHCEVWNVICSR